MRSTTIWVIASKRRLRRQARGQHLSEDFWGSMKRIHELSSKKGVLCSFSQCEEIFEFN